MNELRLPTLLMALLTLPVTLGAVSPPAIYAAVNNYSPGVPVYNTIAQGSIFFIAGAGLSNQTTGLLTAPLPLNLDDVAVSITVAGKTSSAPLYYLSPTQIDAVLPSGTPVGTAQITVANNGQTSAPFSITVVQSRFGIYNVNGGEGGMALALHGDYRPVDFFHAAQPGETIAFWGTGAGPSTDPDGVVPAYVNLAAVPIEVDIGGISSPVSYHGRSGYPGLDQINVTIPSGPVGCFVSLAVLSGQQVSNIVTIPIAQAGGTCTENASGLTIGTMQKLSATGSLSTGIILMSQVGDDIGSAQFYSYTALDLATGVFGGPTAPGCTTLDNCLLTEMGVGAIAGVSPGSCSVSVFGLTYPNYPSFTPVGTPSSTGDLMFSSSAGSSDLYYYSSVGAYFTTSNPGSTGVDPSYFMPMSGPITATSKGGEVGAIDVTIDVGSSFVWTNQTGLTSIDRTGPITVAWTGGDPGGWIEIAGITTPDFSNGGAFRCLASASDQKFTIPPSVLLNLPPAAQSAFSMLSVQPVSSAPFTASGLDTGIVTAAIANLLVVQYQ
jgi:uncharacterized protein (TIGR03437 family)